MAKQVKQRPSPNGKLMRIFDTEQESEAMVVRGLLETAGIDCDVTSLDAQQEILPGVGGTIILVREEDAATARRLIEEYHRVPGDDEAIEVVTSREERGQERSDRPPSDGAVAEMGAESHAWDTGACGSVNRFSEPSIPRQTRNFLM